MFWETRLTVNHENHKAATSTLIGKFHFMIISCSGNAHEYGQCSQGRPLSAELHQKSFCNICNLITSFFTPYWICRGCAPLHFYSSADLRTPDSPKKETQKQLEEPASSNLYTRLRQQKQGAANMNYAQLCRMTAMDLRACQGPARTRRKPEAEAYVRPDRDNPSLWIVLFRTCNLNWIFWASKRRKHKLNISLYELFLPKPTIFTIENKKTIKWIRLFKNM